MLCAVLLDTSGGGCIKVRYEVWGGGGRENGKLLKTRRDTGKIPETTKGPVSAAFGLL